MEQRIYEGRKAQGYAGIYLDKNRKSKLRLIADAGYDGNLSSAMRALIDACVIVEMPAQAQQDDR